MGNRSAELVGHKDQLLQIILSSEGGSWLVRDIIVSVIMSVVTKGYLTCADALEDLSDVVWLKTGKRDGCLDGFSSIV
eukprot:CAMPEP_0198116084 /NCGR_PEP_ID=MMETSP1442-20131203/9444_1 /TAXON_ID= /ORGANISM="Craspedostauros australis, Strain CCMP3328" /LENGTH=77 /DNA_ID=CAMNT_0043773775 /DNA_START=58 /DNA_END=288 /DNA_ORIENTATION=-